MEDFDMPKIFSQKFDKVIIHLSPFWILEFLLSGARIPATMAFLQRRV